MNFQNITPNESIALFMKNIWLFENEKNKHTSFPFFADGYTGLMFHESENSLMAHPHNKEMPSFFTDKR